jgi:hypothetical protein
MSVKAVPLEKLAKLRRLVLILSTIKSLTLQNPVQCVGF